MMKYLIIAIVFCFLMGCRSNGKLQPVGDNRLQGTWQEQNSEVKDSLIDGEYANLRLSCDSFYLILDVFSKENVRGDTCYGNGKWKEYAKGTYIIKDDTLALMGAYTKANFKQKISGCHRINYLNNYYVIRSIDDKQMILSDVRGHGNFILNRTATTTCTPKEIF